MIIEIIENIAKNPKSNFSVLGYWIFRPKVAKNAYKWSILGQNQHSVYVPDHFAEPKMIDCWFTSYARIRIKTRMPPERGRSSWQLGQVLQIGCRPGWRRGQGIISPISCFRSRFSVATMVITMAIFRAFVATLFAVDKIWHACSQTTVIRIIWKIFWFSLSWVDTKRI